MKHRSILIGLIAVLSWFAATDSRATLPVTNGLVLWLEPETPIGPGNGDPVSLWPDSSPSNNDAINGTSSQQGTYVLGAINGHPAVQFSDDNHQHIGNDDWIGVSRQTFTNGLTYVAVFSTLNTTTLKTYPMNAGNTLIGDNHGAVRNGFGVTGGKLEMNIYDEQAGNFSYQSSGSVADGELHVGMVTLAPSGASNLQLFLDNNLEASATRSNLMHLIGFNRISGGWGDGGSTTRDTFDGLIGEILVYDRVLSSTERNQVYNYLLAEFVVPEPSTTLLLGVGGWVLWRRRRNAC